MNAAPDFDELFEHRLSYPDPIQRDRLNRLVGLDNHKLRLAKILGLLLDPGALTKWSSKFHPGAPHLVDLILSRPPLLVLAGDVGSGKTELAESIGDAVARDYDLDLTLLPMSLTSRGQGRVGEMTRLISAAFEHTVSEARKFVSETGKRRGGIILFIDEADALAQSRESGQMHHEDRAGVNALIRGVDRLGNGRLPAAVIMCTNRAGSLDPAIKRRAADILNFHRPDDAQRRTVLERHLGVLGFSTLEIDNLVDATGSGNGREYGFTFSDLTQRLLPAIALDAYPTREITFERALQLAAEMESTPPFREEDA